MTCFHPLVARWWRRNENGKLDLKIVNKDITPDKLVEEYKGYHYMLIPCGKCVGCRIAKARDWAVRISMESLYYPDTSYFITLTYDDAHFPGYNLHEEHIKKFIKGLRNYQYYKTGDKLRYFYCMEYGDTSGRPHGHLILFGFPLNDLKPIHSRNGYITYTSELISQFWEYGYHEIGLVNYKTAGYVARYTLKKRGDDHYDRLGVRAPFIRMSTQPGIGYRYYEDHKYDMLRDKAVTFDGKSYPIPKYFWKLFEKDGIDVQYLKDELMQSYYDYVGNFLFAGIDYASHLKASELEELNNYIQRGRL